MHDALDRVVILDAAYYRVQWFKKIKGQVYVLLGILYFIPLEILSTVLLSSYLWFFQ